MILRVKRVHVKVLIWCVCRIHAEAWDGRRQLVSNVTWRVFTCYFCWRLTAAKNFIQLRLSIRSQRLWRSIYVTSSVSYVTFQLYKSFKSQFALHNTFTEHIKATFHCSSQLQSWSNDQVCDQVVDKFVRVCDTLSTFLSKTCREPAASISTCRQVRWFVRVLDKWNVEKKPF